MKKSLQLVLAVCFFIALLLPSVGILWKGESKASGNEILLSRPSLMTKEGDINFNFLTQFSDYFSKRFAYRTEMITLDAVLSRTLFGTSANDQVVLGEGDWLYYTPTLSDYAGIGLSDGELNRIADRLYNMQEEAEAQGVLFLFTIVPNKNSVIPQWMPDAFPCSRDTSTAARLIPILRESGIRYVDLYQALDNESLWYHTDSHWNRRGAAVGADRICRAAGLMTDFSSGDFAGNGFHEGDLYAMLYPAAQDPEPELEYVNGFSHSSLNDPRNGEALTIHTECSYGAPLRLFCYRDSFGINLYPYLADAFQAATFSRSADYSMSVLDSGEYDVILIEIVERNLEMLADEAD